MRKLLHLLGLTLLVASMAMWAGTVRAHGGHEIPAAPTDIPIVDQTNTLSAEQKNSLAAKIAAETSKSGNQIAILIIPSLDGQAIEEYSIEVARAWGIGTKENNNGVLLLIALNDRQLRIEVGYGLEGALTDARSSQIIRNRITPEFRQGRYYEGINSGLDGIIAAIHNEYDAAISTSPPQSNGFDWGSALFFLFFIPMWLGSILARSKSWWAGGVIGGIAGVVIGLIFGFMLIGYGAMLGLILLGLLFDWLVSKNYQQSVAAGHAPSWWAGGSHLGGGGSSGGFGGFGGGSFGGGGSSGSW